MTCSRMKAATWITASLILCAIVACQVTVAPDGTGTVTIANHTFPIPLGLTGLFQLFAGADPVQNKARVENLYSGTPADQPGTAVISLDDDDVTVVPLGAPKLQPAFQTISGSASLDIYIGAASSDDPCATGTYVGTFHLTFADGVITIDDVDLELSAAALAEVVTGTFTICLQMTATVDVSISIEGMDIEFGPAIDEPIDNGTEPECVYNSDCATGEICVNGECVAETVPECTLNSDCAAGEICVNGECVPETAPECTTDADCDAGETCVDGECVAESTPECATDADCDAGETCIDGECVAETPPECTTDADCAAGETCVDGQCMEDTTPECATDADCEASEVCTDGECVPGTTLYPATIEHVETMTAIVTADDFGDWPADAYRSLGGPAVSADGSRLAFGAYGGWDNQEDTRFYVVDSDGSNMANVTGTFPDEAANRYGFGSLRLNDSGDRLFGKDAVSLYTNVIYYYDLPGGNWTRAVDQGLDRNEGWKPFMINGEGSRLFFPHVGEYDAEAGRTPRGLYYADLGGSPVQFLELADLPDPGAVTWMNVLRALGCSADGSVVTFTWDEGYDSADDTLAMWKVGVGSAPVKIPNENHTYIFTSQDLPHKLVSADGSLALYGYYDAGEARQLELIDLGTGYRTPLAADSGVGDFSNSCLSGNGNFVLYGPSGGYLARIDLETGEARDVMSYHTYNNTWSPWISDLTYDGRYLYFAADTGTYGGLDTIFKVDMEPGTGPYDQAPSISDIAFSAASLPNDATTTITLTASISDPQGADNIASVNWISLVDGLEGATWMSSSPLTGWSDMDDDGEDGDEMAGDGIYASNTLKTASGTNVFDSEYKGLPYDVGIRIVVTDLEGNYTIADTVLTITE